MALLRVDARMLLLSRREVKLEAHADVLVLAHGGEPNEGLLAPLARPGGNRGAWLHLLNHRENVGISMSGLR